MTMKVLLPLWIFTVLLMVSCKSSETSPEKSSLLVDFKHLFGNQDLVIGNSYTNAHGEDFRVSKFNYFISNIKLQKSDGTEYVVPQEKSYFLVKLSEKNTHQLALDDIPIGEYSGISFMIGVDSLRNTLEPSRRTGSLDVGAAAEGMYWNWNTGYIFLKLEGNSPVVPAEQNNQFKFHIGGYGGYSSPSPNNIKVKNISFGSNNLTIQTAKTSIVHLKVNLEEFFKNPVAIKLSENNNVEFSSFARVVANNYVNMFSLDFVHN